MDGPVTASNAQPVFDREVLIHIGYHKTASTALQYHLFNNPQLGFFPLLGHPARAGNRLVVGHPRGPNNPFEFDSSIVVSELQLEEIPVGLCPVISYEDLSGHPYSGGQTGWQSAQWLRMTFPRARILITIREQVGMIRSCYDHFLYDGGICSIHEFLTTYNEYQLPMFNLDHFRYDAAVREYQHLFGKAQVSVLPYEMLRDHKQLFADAIYRFMEVPCPDIEAVLAALSTTKNQLDGRQVAVLYKLPWINLLGQKNNNNARGALGWKRTSESLLRLFGLFNTENSRSRARRRIEATIQRQVGNRYAESNDELQRLIGITLADYGYRMPESHSLDKIHCSVR